MEEVSVPGDAELCGEGTGGEGVAEDIVAENQQVSSRPVTAYSQHDHMSFVSLVTVYT
jgi:hypothetical protein